jgi:hypothetical protein
MFDLHFHSQASDGLADLDTVARRISENHDLVLVALTDHDVLTDSVALAAREPRAWVGAELNTSTAYEGRTADMLGLNLSPGSAELSSYLERRRQERVDTFARYGEALRAGGWIFEPPAEIWNLSRLAKPHVVAELRRHPGNRPRFAALGLPVDDPGPRNEDRLYRRVLDPIREPALATLSVPDTIALIHRAGGLAVLAHPIFAPYTEGRIPRRRARRAIAAMVEAGLDGLEVFHERQTDPAIITELLGRAALHRLLVSVGCDDHTIDLGNLGRYSPAPEDPRGLEWLAEIQERAQLRRKQAGLPGSGA